MKKILLTLFAVAAIFVACDKDALDQDITNINVLEQAEEINASVDVDFNTLKNQLEGLMGATSKIGVSRSTTQRGGDNGDNWIELTAFNGTGADSNAIFAHVYTEGNELACYDGFTYNGAPVTTSTYSFDPDGRTPGSVGILTIEVDGATQDFDIREPLRATYITNFGSSFNAVYRVATTSNGGFSVSGSQPNAGDFTFAACDSWTPVSPDGIGVYNNPVQTTESYTIYRAPFPLDGYLATYTGSTGSSLNYAGTSLAAVIAQIECDINDNCN